MPIEVIHEHWARHWWALVVRGVLAIAFGILVALLPVVALSVLVFAYGIYAIADGVSSFAALAHPNPQNRGWLIASGVAGIAAGIIALVWPAITVWVLLMVIAIWAIVLGVSEEAHAFRYGRFRYEQAIEPARVEHAWLSGLSGILWIGFGIIALVWPGHAIAGVLALIAVFAILRGVMLIAVGLHMRGVASRLSRLSGPPRPPAHA